VESRAGSQALEALSKKEATFSTSQAIGASWGLKILRFTPRSVYLSFTEGLESKLLTLGFPALVS